MAAQNTVNIKVCKKCQHHKLTKDCTFGESRHGCYVAVKDEKGLRMDWAVTLDSRTRIPDECTHKLEHLVIPKKILGDIKRPRLNKYF